MQSIHFPHIMFLGDFFFTIDKVNLILINSELNGNKFILLKNVNLRYSTVHYPVNLRNLHFFFT